MNTIQKHKNKIEKLIKDNNLSDNAGFLISSPVNRLWFSGFKSTAGYILVTKELDILIVDGRYHQMAIEFKEMINVNEIINSNHLELSLLNLCKKMNISELGVEADSLSYLKIGKMRQLLKDVTTIFPIDTSRVRTCKGTSEIAKIKHAVKIIDETFTYIFKKIKSGMTEKEVACLVDEKIISLGADSTSFPTIIASGPNSAIPHHHPTERKIKAGDFVVIDIGAIYQGYCSDMTRTVCIEKVASEELVKIYEIVARAQLLAIEGIELDVNYSNIDHIARCHIVDNGYGDNFNHGTGHGLGLEIHEEGYLNQTNGVDKIEVGNVFTVEPGVYIPHLGGVRIEDDIFINTKGKAVVLGSTTKKLLILNNN